MIKKIMIFLFMFGYYSFSQSNDFFIEGKVLDSINKQPLQNATVLIQHLKTESKHYGLSQKDGNFEIKNLSPGKYSLKISFVGYNDYLKEILINKNYKSNLGQLLLQPSEVLLNQVNVTGKAPIAEVKEDTTVFNATSYKTQPDAVAEDLVKKMPGMTVETDGTVKAQGEQVKKVLVDGKEFFSADPSAALRNIPAENVQSIQVFDKFSDNAEFTGFDDGLSEKTINIITKENKRNGQFAKINAGGGTDNKYSINANANFFDNTQRVSILGMSNNVNQQNFSFSDILGALNSSNERSSFFSGMMNRTGGPVQGFRPPGGGRGMFGGGAAGFSASDFMVGQQDGISTTHSLGLNYIDLWTEDLEVSGSYFFNYSENDKYSNTDRDYLIENYFYASNDTTSSRNINHRANLVFKYVPSKTDQFSFRPNFTFQYNNNNSFQNNLTNSDTSIISKIGNNYNYNYSGLNFSSELLYRHAFELKGRTITLSFNNSYNNKDGYSYQDALYQYLNLNNYLYDTLDQKSLAPQNGYGLSLSGTYTEPLGSSALLSLTYSSSYNKSGSDKKTYDYNYLDSLYSTLNNIYSNVFDNDYFKQSAGIGLKYRYNDFNLTASVNYQRSDLINNQDFPLKFDSSYVFEDILPSLLINYKFSQKTNFRLNYRASTNAPSVTQLQNVVDNTNPTSLYTGNPDLKQQYSHSIFGRLQSMGSDFTQMFMWNFHFMTRSNYIANNTFYALTDTTIDGVALSNGVQYTKPINLDGYMDGRTFITYGFPFPYIPINCNFNIGGGYSATPSMYNGQKNEAKTISGNAMLVLASNISENIDFTFSGGATINSTKNSIATSSNSKYNNYFANFNFNWIFWEGFFIGGNARELFYTGLKSQGSTNFSLVNLHIGKKFFNNAAEVRLAVYDAFDQNKSIQTNVSDYYREDVYSNVLKRYALLSFTINYKDFKPNNTNKQ